MLNGKKSFMNMKVTSLYQIASYMYLNYYVYALHTVATQLCNILLDNTPVDDIITVFSSHDLLMGDDVTVVTNAPSDHLKKMFLLRLFQSISLSVWSVICDVVSRSETLKHLSDQLNGNICSC